ncbi:MULTISPECIES: Mbeg1-like protein [unclassified Breznakia]|nr:MULTISPECIES: Mbeg1-like protein [unclassified Breznakia]MDF9838787.1 hypothetical protein [Breznakia sp. PFB2-8]MDF9860825.1 hypothetical protein [Breznakia sp. PH5-24]
MVPLTPQQQNALNYANRIAKDYSQYDFIVSGHSKGGNKAQVVTLLCDKVKAGYSFDGQGMGKGFMIKYRLQIEQNQHKLVSISNRSDFVNSLFKSVAGKVKFTNNTGNLLDWLMSGDKDIAMHQHSPLAMFEIKDGYLRMFDTKGIKQDSTSLFLGNMVDYFREHMSEDDFETFANLVMHMFETGGCGDKHFDIKNIDPEFWVRLINHILKYGEELGMKENDMLLLLSNLSIFIPDDSVWGYVLEAIKLFRNPGGILADAIIADETPRRLNEIMVEYNSKYSEVMKKKEIIRDFSSEAQEAMRDSLACEIDRSQLSMESTPGWGYVAEILSDTGVLESHHKVEELCNELLDTCEVTEAKYNKIIEEVYAKDHEFAQRLKKKTDRIRDYRAVIRKARNK